MAISLVALIAMAALVIDAGRLYIINSKMQTAADACALAAVQQLDKTANGVARATAAGRELAARNMADGVAVSLQPVSVSFGTSLWPSPDGTFSTTVTNFAAIRYARCTLTSNAISLVGSLIDRGSFSLTVRATSENMPALEACALPMAVCARETFAATSVTDDVRACRCQTGYEIKIGTGQSAVTWNPTTCYNASRAGDGSCPDPGCTQVDTKGQNTYRCFSELGPETFTAPRLLTMAPKEAGAGWGLIKGQWVEAPKSPSSYQFGPNTTGSYNWASLYGANGAAGIVEEMGDVCNIDIRMVMEEGIGNSGKINSLERAWDSRLGIYRSDRTIKGKIVNDCAGDGGTTRAKFRGGAPDFTGYGFKGAKSTPQPNPYSYPDAPANIPVYNVYDRTSVPTGSGPAEPQGPLNYLEAAQARTPFQRSVGNNECRVDTAAAGATVVQNRRLVVLPVVRCSDWAKKTSRNSVDYVPPGGVGEADDPEDPTKPKNPQKAKVRGWICGLIVDRAGSPSSERMQVEIIGRADDPGSPCGMLGAPVKDATTGRVPALVQ